MSTQKETKPKAPPLNNPDVPIVSSYRREKHLDEIKTAALHFLDIGLLTYPPPWGKTN